MADSWIRSLQASDRFLGQIRRLNSFGASECKQVGHLSRQVQNLQGLKLEETPNMLAAVNACQFYSQESKDSLLQSIVEKTDAATDSTIKETKLQDYTNLSRFLPEKVMKYILDPNLPTCEVLCLICQWASVLGLKRPTEGTVGTLTCLAHWKEWSKNDISSASKHIMLQKCKKEIKEHLAHFTEVCKTPSHFHLQKLPDGFADLPVELQGHFAGEYLGFDF